MRFSHLDLDLRLPSSLRALGFEQPTPIQSGVIPIALSGHDLVGSAETGTGKTAAFLLLILQKLLAVSERLAPKPKDASIHSLPPPMKQWFDGSSLC